MYDIDWRHWIHISNIATCIINLVLFRSIYQKWTKSCVAKCKYLGSMGIPSPGVCPPRSWHAQSWHSQGWDYSWLGCPILMAALVTPQPWGPTAFPVSWLVISQSCSKFKCEYFNSLCCFSRKGDNMNCSHANSSLWQFPLSKFISSKSATTSFYEGSLWGLIWRSLKGIGNFLLALMNLIQILKLMKQKHNSCIARNKWKSLGCWSPKHSNL